MNTFSWSCDSTALPPANTESARGLWADRELCEAPLSGSGFASVSLLQAAQCRACSVCDHIEAKGKWSSRTPYFSFSFLLILCSFPNPFFCSQCAWCPFLPICIFVLSMVGEP